MLSVVKSLSKSVKLSNVSLFFKKLLNLLILKPTNCQIPCYTLFYGLNLKFSEIEKQKSISFSKLQNITNGRQFMRRSTLRFLEGTRLSVNTAQLQSSTTFCQRVKTSTSQSQNYNLPISSIPNFLSLFASFFFSFCDQELSCFYRFELKAATSALFFLCVPAVNLKLPFARACIAHSVRSAPIFGLDQHVLLRTIICFSSIWFLFSSKCRWNHLV